MIQLPHVDRRTTLRALFEANQILVNEGDYGLLKVLLYQGETVRFRIKCHLKPVTGCRACLPQVDDESFSTFSESLYNYIEDQIEACPLVWDIGVGCLPRKGQIEIVAKPIMFLYG